MYVGAHMFAREKGTHNELIETLSSRLEQPTIIHSLSGQSIVLIMLKWWMVLLTSSLAKYIVKTIFQLSNSIKYIIYVTRRGCWFYAMGIYNVTNHYTTTSRLD